MQINIYQKNVNLSDQQKEYVSSKLEALKKFKLTQDSSALAKVEVEFHESKISDKDYSVNVTLVVPHHQLRAEVNSISVEEGVDLAEEKLRHQLEKIKG